MSLIQLNSFQLASDFPNRDFSFINQPHVHQLCRCLEKAAVLYRFIGGCVRDSLLGIHTNDIDLATPALPQHLYTELEAAGYHPLTHGLKHGTIMVVHPPYHFEITTLRQDVATNGRWAEVQYTADWQLDAMRRDFTINALSFDQDGLYDYTSGLEDLKLGKLQFIGNPSARIQEDYLRILRLFRFYQRYGKIPLDLEILKICAKERFLLQKLSGERIWQEFYKILQGRNPLPILATINQYKIFEPIFQGLFDQNRMNQWQAIVHALPLAFQDPFRLFLLALPDGLKTPHLAQRLALTRDYKQRLLMNFAQCPQIEDRPHTTCQQTMMMDGWCDQILAQSNLTDGERIEFLGNRWQTWLWLQNHPCPVTAKHLLAHGYSSVNFKLILKALHTQWIDCQGKLTYQDLIQNLEYEYPTLL